MVYFNSEKRKISSWAKIKSLVGLSIDYRQSTYDMRKKFNSLTVKFIFHFKFKRIAINIASFSAWSNIMFSSWIV